jgi:hypothetical protein
MGTVVTFPEARPNARAAMDSQSGSATVIILPVVRIERYDAGPPSEGEPPGISPGRRRRPRASRT